MLAELLAQSTRENDLDKEEKLAKSEKYANDTIQMVKAAPKPNPQLSDAAVGRRQEGPHGRMPTTPWAWPR